MAENSLQAKFATAGPGDPVAWTCSISALNPSSAVSVIGNTDVVSFYANNMTNQTLLPAHTTLLIGNINQRQNGH